MTPENFCYWLQGFFEITGEVKELTPEQIKMVKQHLGYVFNQPATTQQIVSTPQIAPDLGTPYLGYAQAGVEPLILKC